MIPTLIVDDEFLVRLGLKTILDWKSEGYTIVGEAVNGAEALDLYHKYRPRLILTDIKMPKKDGISLMREIRAIDGNVKFIVLTAYNEFDYAKDAIEVGVEAYLLKGSILDEELRGVLQKIRQQIIQLPAAEPAAISAEGVSLDEITASKGLVRDLPPPDSFSQAHQIYICCARVVGVQEASLRHSLNELCENILTQMRITFVRLYDEKYFYAAIAGDEPPTQCMQALFDAAQRYLGREIYCGISDAAAETGEVLRYAAQAKNACNMNIVRIGGNIQKYEAPSFTKSKKSKMALEALSRSILEGNKALCAEALDSLKEEICQSGSTRFLYHTLYSLVLTLGQYYESLSESEIYTKLLDRDKIDLIFEDLSNMFIEVCQKLVHLLPQSSLHVERAKTFIRANLEKNIKLLDVSHHIHLSPNYLGKLFYNETGVYLTDYIMIEKIMLACELLKKNDLLISQVAQQVGIADQQYFSKIFKKKIGVSPKEYAQKQRHCIKPE